MLVCTSICLNKEKKYSTEVCVCLKAKEYSASSVISINKEKKYSTSAVNMHY
jgi:predicted fused transcriptional regulator/phosphomethylpyrimidine kinase